VAVVAALAGTTQAAPSGDTCSYTASGGVNSVKITTAGGAEQYGFAFATPGLALTNVVIPGQNGNFTTAKLPASTSGAWISDTPMTGTISATLSGNGALSGPVVVVPSASGQNSYFDPITCKAGIPTEKTVSFTVNHRATYSKAARGWHLVATIPVPGTVSAKQTLATSISDRPDPDVLVKREALKTGGKVTLLVRTTPRGDRVLAREGVLKIKLTVTFDARDGRENHKTFSLALRR
jgi:hypothetical protein